MEIGELSCSGAVGVPVKEPSCSEGGSITQSAHGGLKLIPRESARASAKPTTHGKMIILDNAPNVCSSGAYGELSETVNEISSFFVSTQHQLFLATRVLVPGPHPS